MFRVTQNAEGLDAGLDALIALHAVRWGPKGPFAFAPAARPSHRDFARRALAPGRLRLWLAEVDGRAVTAWYRFRFTGREVYYQVGRDPAWDEHAVGFGCGPPSIRAALDDAILEYRFGLGDEPYNARFISPIRPGDPRPGAAGP